MGSGTSAGGGEISLRNGSFESGTEGLAKQVGESLVQAGEDGSPIPPDILLAAYSTVLGQSEKPAMGEGFISRAGRLILGKE